MFNLALIKKELTEQWRTNKILIIVASFLFLGMSGPVTTRFLPEILKNSAGSSGFSLNLLRKLTATDYALSFFKQMVSLPILILILVAMGTVAGERERGTHILVLTKPVSRTQFITSKYLSFLAILAGTILLAALGAAYYTILLAEVGTLAVGPFVLLCLAMFGFMSFILALVVFFSSFFRTSVAAGGASFGVYLVLIIGGGLLPEEAGKYLPSNFANQAGAILEGKLSSGELLKPLLTSFVLSILLTGLACFLAEKREM